MSDREPQDDPLIRQLSDALRSRGDLPPEKDLKALDHWLEKFIEQQTSPATHEHREEYREDPVVAGEKTSGDHSGAQIQTVSGPSGWPTLLMENVDFDSAYSALEGYNHFHTESLRGKVRSLQLRTKEAFEHFRKAEALAEGVKLTKDVQIKLFYLRVYCLENAFIEEARQSSEESSIRTDYEFRRVIEFELPEELVLEQIRTCGIATHKLIRGDFQSALDTFESLINESRYRLEDQQVVFFCGAAGAAKALGKVDLAERHYENAALMVNSLTQPFKIGAFSAQLYTLSKHWGWEEKAEEWMHILERLPCPEASRRCFIERAKVLTAASALRNRVFIVLA